MHDHAQGGTIVLQALKGRTAVRHWFYAIYCRVSIVWGSFGWGVWSASTRVSLSLSQTPLGDKLG